MSNANKQKNKNKKKKIQSLIIWIVIATVFIFVLLFISIMIYKDFESLNNMNSYMQIITNIFVVLGVIIALWQYISAKKQELYYYEKDRVKLAVEVAEYYKRNVLVYSRELKKMLEDIDMLEIVESIEMDKIQYFDIQENEKIYSQKQVRKIKSIRSKYGIDDMVIDKSISYRTVEHEQYNSPNKDEKGIQSIGENYVRLMFEILNNLEIFSMYFVHETADESVVYQPLHMSYLEIVRMLYYDISYANRNGNR